MLTNSQNPVEVWDDDEYEEMKTNRAGAGVIVAVGVIIATVSFVGCCGALKDNKVTETQYLL